MPHQMENKLSDYQHYIAASKYARFLPEQKRRETWTETVERYCNFFATKYPDIFPKEVAFTKIFNLEVMPSMRGLMTAGKALDRDNASVYNCAYVAVDDPRAFDESMYLLMCSCGVGFSVERQLVNKLPQVSEDFHETDTIIKVRDSKIGWASALRELIAMLYSGQVPKWDLSALRPAGAPLKTFGGRSSGPGPLADLFGFTVRLFRGAAGRRLQSIECHDLMNMIASAIVAGGVRRSAEISLSNLSDDRMRNAKMGQWQIDNPQRNLSNNSVAYTEKPEMGVFIQEWKSLYDSKSGERGIFNRDGALKKMKQIGRRDYKKAEEMALGCNPCGEIFLRSCGFCNLTEVIIRPKDTLETLKEKVEYATILGTFQSSLTDFRYLRAIWKRNAEEERLLGVSLTGIMDHKVLSKTANETAEWLLVLNEHAIKINEKWAKKLGINQSVAVTTVKPSGTVSQLVDASSGIHGRYASFFLRTARSDKLDPIGIFLKEQGVYCEDDVTNNKNWIFYFPTKSPDHARLASSMSAIDQLEHYLLFYRNWSEHAVSVSIYVKEEEWLEVGAWVYKHFDECGGLSFFPYSDHVYKQAPYQPITKDEYDEWVKKTPKIDWSKFVVDEHEDKTEGAQNLACQGGACEIP